MDTSRREFVLGTAAGFILPSFYEKVLSYWERTGEPLIIVPPEPKIELFAVDRGFGAFELNLGDPWAGPPRMTIREFANLYGDGDPETWYREGWCGDENEAVDWDSEMDPNWVLDSWCRTESPNAKAYDLLDQLDLGPTLVGAEAVGELQFIDGPCPGNDYLAVEAVDQISISLLQQRLNDLRTGIRIQMA